MNVPSISPIELVLANVLPGYQLLRATVTVESWPAGWYALAKQGTHDPVLLFPGPACDPLFESAGDMPAALEQDCNDFLSALACMRERLVISLTEAACLGVACRDAGYRRDLHGDIECWLLHYLSQRLEPAGLPDADAWRYQVVRTAVTTTGDIPATLREFVAVTAGSGADGVNHVIDGLFAFPGPDGALTPVSRVSKAETAVFALRYRKLRSFINRLGRLPTKLEDYLAAAANAKTLPSPEALDGIVDAMGDLSYLVV